MAKELYLYSGIYSFTAADLIKQMDECGDDDMTMRINSPGGDVMAGWGIIAKMKECSGKVKVKVDGAAMSMAIMPVVFADEVECLDVSTFMLHRAAMYGTLTSDQQSFLDKVNKDLRGKLESKVNANELLALKGVSITDLFEKEERIDLFLTAKEAKKIGLVNKINKLTPELEAEMSALHTMFHVAAHAEQNKPTNMTKDQLKASHPDVYNQIFNEGAESMGQIAEAWAHFAGIDAKAVSEGIKSRKPMTQLQMIEMTQKQFTTEKKKDIEDDSEKKTLATGEAPKTDAEKEKTAKADWLKEIKAETTTFKIA